jgi:hypothetical protein
MMYSNEEWWSMSEVQRRAATLQNHPLLTKWEKDFCHSVQHYHRELSEKQQKVMDRIGRKVADHFFAGRRARME